MKCPYTDGAMADAWTHGFEDFSSGHPVSRGDSYQRELRAAYLHGRRNALDVILQRERDTRRAAAMGPRTAG